MPNADVTRGPERKVSVIDVLEVMVASPDPAFTTTELAGKLDTTGQTIRNRLSEMDERGFVQMKDSGRAMVVWLTPEGSKFYTENR